MVWRRSPHGIPAITASTSSSTSTTRFGRSRASAEPPPTTPGRPASPRSPPAAATLWVYREHRVFRIESRLGVLERRRHVLSWVDPRVARPRLHRHLLRARRVRAPAASGHRGSAMGAGRRLREQPGRIGKSTDRIPHRRRRRQGERRRRVRRRARSGGPPPPVRGARGGFGCGCPPPPPPSGGGAPPAPFPPRPPVRHYFLPPPGGGRVGRAPADPFHACVPKYDLILTYGGGEPVCRAYRSFGAHECVPIYNALDPHTHFAVAPDPRFACDLGFLGNRLPDREARVDE